MDDEAYILPVFYIHMYMIGKKSDLTDIVIQFVGCWSGDNSNLKVTIMNS